MDRTANKDGFIAIVVILVQSIGHMVLWRVE
jgi:hypothetical protein